MTAWLVLIDEELYRAQDVEPCVSELWSARPGVSHARLHGEQSGIEVRFTVPLGPFKFESLGFPQ